MNSIGQLDGGVIAGLAVFNVVVIAFCAWVYVRIVRTAGYNGWWVLMAPVSIGTIIMICLCASTEWPVRRELDHLRGYAAHTGLPGYGPPPDHPGP